MSTEVLTFTWESTVRLSPLKPFFRDNLCDVNGVSFFCVPAAMVRWRELRPGA